MFFAFHNLPNLGSTLTAKTVENVEKNTTELPQEPGKPISTPTNMVS